jgi:hypothetical protein
VFANFAGTAACAVLITFAVVTAAASADVQSYSSKDGDEITTLVGTIDVGDAQVLQAIIKTANDHGRRVTAIRLNSPGGILVEGTKLAEVIRSGKIATVVPAGSECASACFLVFAAGVEKFASYNSNVGVHCASDQAGIESADATVLMGRMAEELGVPGNLIDRMVATPPDEIAWLSSDDLRSMGVTVKGKPSQLAMAKVMPHAPMQLDPSDKEHAEAPIEWEDVVDGAFKISKLQNGGQPNVLRLCEPKLKLCNTAVLLKDKDGNSVMVRLASDASGRMVSLNICTFNSFEDIRTCVDWDSKVTTRELKDSNGNWHSIAHDWPVSANEAALPRWP